MVRTVNIFSTLMNRAANIFICKKNEDAALDTDSYRISVRVIGMLSQPVTRTEKISVRADNLTRGVFVRAMIRTSNISVRIMMRTESILVRMPKMLFQLVDCLVQKECFRTSPVGEIKVYRIR
jgi:hypothetical protein